LVISVDGFTGIPFHVPLAPPEDGLRQPGFIPCEDVRSISLSRLRERWGTVKPATLAAVEDRLRILLGVVNLPQAGLRGSWSLRPCFLPVATSLRTCLPRETRSPDRHVDFTRG
jgi:hypothetical protein